MRKKPRKQGDEWLDAKRRCGLSDDEVRMAKELGFKPHSLIKNIPAKSQQWKAPIREWIRELHAKRFSEARRAAPDNEQQAQAPRLAGPVGPAIEDLLPQWDTANEEPYFTRGSDGEVLSLEEAAVLLDVCPTTVRRYTNRGVLKCYRTPGNQRRFRLSEIMSFMERRQRGT